MTYPEIEDFRKELCLRLLQRPYDSLNDDEKYQFEKKVGHEYKFRCDQIDTIARMEKEAIERAIERKKYELENPFEQLDIALDNLIEEYSDYYHVDPGEIENEILKLIKKS